ncbi:hypothetical protein [Myxococcus stipitatus]|uniref:hypothetical protein n=1 Tax=Myxococcus stipitatus TaxID=83455 RepID=UPI0030CD93DF
MQRWLHVGEAFGNIGEHLRRLTILSFTSRPEVSHIETSLVFSFTSHGLPVDPGA